MQYFISFLVVSLIHIATASSDAPNLAPIQRKARYYPALKAQNSTSFIGEVNVTSFPSCAYTNCIASDLFSPSRLGCLAGTLTTDCFCNTAATPLSCAPTGPSDEDNCWYDLENWFASVCGESVATIQPATMPECIQDCVLDYITQGGCRTQTRNCFCKIDAAGLINATTICQTHNCTSKMQSSFVPSTWRNDICLHGTTINYDQASYDKYVKMVHDTRIAIPVVMSLIAAVVVIWGIVAYGPTAGLVASCVIAVILILITVVPVYTAL